MAAKLSAWSVADWQSAQAQQTVPDKLQNWRNQQLQEFLQRGFPLKREENWKYTPVTALIESIFDYQEPSPEYSLDLTPYTVPGAYQLVFIDGKFAPHYSKLTDLPESVKLMPGIDALRQFPELYQRLNHLEAQTPLSVFHWLNGALLNDGLFLSIPDHCELKKPVHLLYLSTGHHGAPMRSPRNMINLGVNSRAEIIEEYCGLEGGYYFNNVMTRINTGDSAQLDYYKLQRENTAAFHIGNTSIEPGRDSRVRAFHIALGSRLNREDLHVALRYPGAECVLSGFYYPKCGQHIDFHTRIDHEQSQTQSRQYYKGMIAAQGKAVFNGKIIVHAQAQQITAKQENHNLLLADSAEINTKPELEVFADNVQCTHGATVGNLDENALFYLRSRGIPELLAQRLLRAGFVQEILDALPSALIKEYLQTALGEN